MLGTNLENETFENVGGMYDWRYYILPETRAIWKDLPLLAKIMLYDSSVIKARNAM